MYEQLRNMWYNSITNKLNHLLSPKQPIDNCYFPNFCHNESTPVITIIGGAIMQLNLGTKIRTLRQRDGRTQDALAEALGVSAQAVSRWESGGSLS